MNPIEEALEAAREDARPALSPFGWSHVVCLGVLGAISWVPFEEVAALPPNVWSTGLIIGAGLIMAFFVARAVPNSPQ